MDDDEDETEVILSYTHSRDPQYITDRGVRKEAACEIASARYANPKIEISQQFADNAIRGFVQGTNHLTLSSSHDSHQLVPWKRQFGHELDNCEC